jgi:hypothetical protein
VTAIPPAEVVMFPLNVTMPPVRPVMKTTLLVVVLLMVAAMLMSPLPF